MSPTRSAHWARGSSVPQGEAVEWVLLATVGQMAEDIDQCHGGAHHHRNHQGCRYGCCDDSHGVGQYHQGWENMFSQNHVATSWSKVMVAIAANNTMSTAMST